MGAAPDASDSSDTRLSRLIVEEKRLQNELKQLSQDDPDYLILSRSINEELNTVQSSIRKLTHAKSTLQTALPTSHGAASLPDSIPPTGAAPIATGQTGSSGLFGQIKQDLLTQLKQVRQMLQSIRPQEGRLALLLQTQEKDLVKQLQEVDRLIAEMGGVAPRPGEIVPPGNTPKSKPVSQEELNALTKPVRPEVTYSWTDTKSDVSGAGHAPPPSPAILEIRQMLVELKGAVDKLNTELAAMNTQLRVISHRVAAELPGAGPADSPSSRPDTR